MRFRTGCRLKERSGKMMPNKLYILSVVIMKFVDPILQITDNGEKIIKQKLQHNLCNVNKKNKKVKTGQYIKGTISIPLYLFVIYYLLPVRPLYLYYSSQHNPAAIVNELKREKADQNINTISFNNQLCQNNDTFPKKDRVCFFFETGFVVTSPLNNEFIFVSKDVIRIFLHLCYQPPLVDYNSSRGPPLA